MTLSKKSCRPLGLSLPATFEKLQAQMKSYRSQFFSSLNRFGTDPENDTIISLEVEEHCDEITDSAECNLSDHCEWHADEGACEDEGHDDGDDHEGHHELGFELTGLSAGTTTFVLSLMHDGHADYTSLPISVTVTQEQIVSIFCYMPEFFIYSGIYHIGKSIRF